MHTKKKKEWQDDVQRRPVACYHTQVHVCMYLILSPSSYSEQDMMNYKSLDSYQNFVKGWLRKVFVRPVGNEDFNWQVSWSTFF